MNITALYLDVSKPEKDFQVVEFDRDSLIAIYTLLDCEGADFVYRKFANNNYTVICDDMGRLRDNPIVSVFAWGKKIRPDIVGNVLICGFPDVEGNLTSLSVKDINNILSVKLSYKGRGKVRPCLLCK